MSRRGSDYRSPRSFKSLFPTCQITAAESAREDCSPRTAFDELQREIERELQNSEKVLCAASNYKGNASRHVCTAGPSNMISRPVSCEQRYTDAMKCFTYERNDNADTCMRKVQPEYISRPRLADSGIVSVKKPSVRVALPQKAFTKNTPPRKNSRASSAPVRCDSQSSKLKKSRPGSHLDVRKRESQSLKNNKYPSTGGSPIQPLKNQNVESGGPRENQNLNDKKYPKADNSPDNEQFKNQNSKIRKLSQSENQKSEIVRFSQSENEKSEIMRFSQSENEKSEIMRFSQSENEKSEIMRFSLSENEKSEIMRFSQSENEKSEIMRFSHSGVDNYNESINLGKSPRLSLAGSSLLEKTSFHDYHHERSDESPDLDEKSKGSSCHLSSFRTSASEFPCEIDKDFEFLKPCCPKNKEAKKSLKLPEMPCLDTENVRNLIKCEAKDIEASWQMTSDHKKSYKKPCPKQQKAELSVKALVQASKSLKTCGPKYSALEHPEPEDISPDVAAAMMFMQEQGVKMDECPKGTVSHLFPEEPLPPFPEKGSFSEDMIEKSAMVPSEGVSDSAYTRTMRRKGEDLSPQRSYDVDFAIGQSKREYVFVTEKPQRVNVVQFRGGSAPAWFPWYFSAFPDEDDGLKLVNSPSGLFYKAWLHSNPKNIPTSDVIVLD